MAASRFAAVLCLLLLPATTALRRGAERPAEPPQGTHGEGQWTLYSGEAPGWRIKASAPTKAPAAADRDAADLEAAEPAAAEPAEGQEAFQWAEETFKDPCVPHGAAPMGNQYFNTTTPTLIPFMVNTKYENFADAAVVVVPSFAADHMDFENTGLTIAKWLNNKGITAFVLKYRVPVDNWAEREKVIQMDTHRAVSMVRHRANKLRVDPQKIGILAVGATTDLALQASTATARAYDKTDDVDNVDYRPNFLMLVHPRIDLRSVVPAVLKRAPAMFITMSEDDPCGQATSALRLFRGLQDYGAPPSAIHVYPEGKTGYSMCDVYLEYKNMDACNWPKKAEAFLQKRLDMPVNGTNLQLIASNWCPPAPQSADLCGSKANQVRCHGHCDLSCWTSCGGLSLEEE